MLLGEARRLTAQDEVERAMQLITENNSSLTPALSKTSIGAWSRLNSVAVYRVRQR